MTRPQRTIALRLAEDLFVLGCGALLVLGSLVSFQAIAFGAPSSPSLKDSTLDPIAAIDRIIRATWQEHNIRPAAPATDAEWCRRVYLDLIGRVPTIDELQRYLSDKARTRNRDLVDRLLSAEYEQEYARHWTSVWANLLVGRTGGRENRTMIHRPSLEDYLRAALQENQAYDKLAYELINATGSTDPSAEDFNGAVNFLIDKMADNGIQATARTSQLFLGVAVQCTQCHDHQFNEYRQDQFWGLNAFFRQARAEEIRKDERRYGRLVNRDFGGAERRPGQDPRQEVFLEMRKGQLVDRDQDDLYEAALTYEQRNGQVASTFPVFLDGRTLKEEFAERGLDYGNSGLLEHVDRRRELAKLILESRQFEQAIVNRLWGYFFGYGFTKPVDDMGPHNPTSHPELLDALGGAFRHSGFNLKLLIRWIVLSEPYSLSSRIRRDNEADAPAEGTSPRFSRFYLRQMLPEQLYESLLVVTEADATLEKQEREAKKAQWMRQFSTAFGTDEGGESTTFNGTIPQALMMMNGELVRRACSIESGSFLDRIASDPRLSNREKFRHLYRTALGRNPTREETQACNQLLDARGGNVVNTLQDIWWAVLNSNEFILIH